MNTSSPASTDGLTADWRESTPVFDFFGEETSMQRLTTLTAMKNVLTQGVFVAALAALIGIHATGVAAHGQRLWSIVIHFEYQDGFEFDYVLEKGIATADVAAALADCGRSHWSGSVVQYHCYPVQE
jgi:hypothetical protein